MTFVKLTELYMEKSVRDLRDGEDRYADRDIYIPRLTPVWVNLALITSIRINTPGDYANKKPERYPEGYPASVRLETETSSFTVTESVDEILSGCGFQKAASDV